MDATQTFRANQILALKAWRLHYDAMVTAALAGSGRTRRQAAALFDILNTRRYAVHQALESLATSSEGGLEAVRARVEAAWDDLMVATDDVARRLELIEQNQQREQARTQLRAAAGVHDIGPLRGDRDQARAATRARAGAA